MKLSSRRFTYPLLLSASLLLLTTSAKADDGDAIQTASPQVDAPAPSSSPTPTPTPTRLPPTSRWYGYQTLLSDGASIGLIVIGSGVADGRFARDGLTGAGVVGYAVAPSVIHIAHGHVGKGFGALALRVVTPVLGAGIGALVGLAMYTPPPEKEPANLGEAIAQPIVAVVGPVAAMYRGAEIGFVSGAVIAIAIDAGLLAHENVTPTTPSEKGSATTTKKDAASRTSASAMTFTPTIAPTKNGVSAGLSGTF